MDAEPQIGRPGAGDEYARGVRDQEALKACEERIGSRLGYTKVAVAALTLLFLIGLLHQPKLLGLLLLPLALLVGLEIWHVRLIGRVRLRLRSIEFYRRGIARIENRWAGCGETGERFLDASHPYARDLDLFGEGSLFQFLNMARTVAGEETLAAWLLNAAPREEIVARQEAVRELTPELAFRENLFLLGETLRAAVDPDKLRTWAESAPVLASGARRTISSVLALLWVGSLAAWGLWGMGWSAALMTLINLGWSRHLGARLDQAAGAIENAVEDLIVLSGVLALIERMPFRSPRLSGLQAALRTDDIPPSRAIRKLARIVEHLNQRHNLFLRPLDRVTFWSVQLALAAEAWQQKFGGRIRGWLDAVGEMEALNALAAYAFEHPDDSFPEVLAPNSMRGHALFDAEDMAHPLLPTATGVRNSIRLGDELQVVILSGPNMAGKSTFIRAIGLNAVMAQCGAPVRATRLRLLPVTVAASICVLDSLSGGVSRFYAEIRRIKCIVDLSRGPIPVLFLLDELLSGTNSEDRLAGSEFIVRSLAERNAIGIVSTHDLALTRIPGVLGRAANYHFDDRLEKDSLVFDYRLKPGVVTSGNALKLMRAIGLEVAD